MEGWDVWAGLGTALAWAKHKDSVWVLRSHTPCSFRNFVVSRAEVEIWRAEGVQRLMVEVQDYDVEAAGGFTAISANTGETAALLFAPAGCAVFALPPADGAEVQLANICDTLPAKTLVPRSGLLKKALWHPLSDVHVGLLLETRWELMNFSGSSQAFMAAERVLHLSAKDFQFAHTNASLNGLLQVYFLEESGISVHRCVPSVALLSTRLVTECAEFAWLGEPEMEDGVGILRTRSYPPESAFLDLAEGPPPVSFALLTCHPLVVAAVALEEGFVDILSLSSSGPALLCDRVVVSSANTPRPAAVELHGHDAPAAAIVAVSPNRLACTLSLPWVEQLQGGLWNAAGPHTVIRTVATGEIVRWVSIDRSVALYWLAGDEEPRQVEIIAPGREAVALLPPPSRRAVSAFSAPLLLPQKPIFARGDPEPEAFCRMLAVVRKGLLADLSSRQDYMQRFLAEAPKRVQVAREGWEELVVKAQEASDRHRRLMTAMGRVRDTQVALNKEVEHVAARLEALAESANIESVRQSIGRFYAKIHTVQRVIQSLEPSRAMWPSPTALACPPDAPVMPA